jgi:hypothetical protein
MPWTKDGPSAHFTSMCVHSLRKFARARALPFTGAERHMLRGAADVLERQAQRALQARSASGAVGTPLTQAEMASQMTAAQRAQDAHNRRMGRSTLIPFESYGEHVDDEELD